MELKERKYGDILVDSKGADIIICSKIANYVFQVLQKLKRFQKSQFEIVSITNIRQVELKKQSFEIQVPSLRLDCVVTELSKISRNKANSIILQERVLVNFNEETKNNKKLKVGDIITIRGKGRFQIIEFIGKTKRENEKYVVEKWTKNEKICRKKT